MGLRNVDITHLKKTPTFRKLAIGTWDAPRGPEIYGQLDVDIEKALQWREAQAGDGPKITPLHMVAKAMGVAMGRHPDLNGFIRFGRIYLRNDVDTFIQVMTEGKEGRTDLTGVRVSGVDHKSAVQIAEEAAAQVARARDKKDLDVQKTANLINKMPGIIVRWLMNFIAFISYTLNIRMPGIPKDPFAGCMISNIGSLGMDTAFAPLVPYSRCPIVILLGQAKPRPVVIDDQIVIRRIVRLNATIDHRFCDGALLSKMVKTIGEVFDAPEKYFAAETGAAN